MITLQSPSLVLLVIGSTPPSSSYRSRPVAQVLPTLLMWHCSATPSSGSLFPSNRLVLSAVAAYTVGRAGCRGFRPNASATYRHAPLLAVVLMGIQSLLSVATHLLRAGLVTDLPLGILACPLPGLYGPSTYGTSSMVLTYGFVLLAPVPLLCLGRMGCVAGLRVGCLRVWYMLLSFLDRA